MPTTSIAMPINSILKDQANFKTNPAPQKTRTVSAPIKLPETLSGER